MEAINWPQAFAIVGIAVSLAAVLIAMIRSL